MGRVITRRAISLKVPADGFRSKNAALEPEFGFADTDFLGFVQPGGVDISLSSKDEHFRDGNVEFYGVFMNQTASRDGSIVSMGAEHDQWTIF